MPSKRCKRICKARAKVKQKQKQKQVVSQKVIVNVGVQPRRRRKRKARQKSGVAVPKGGAYYDPIPSRLLALTLANQSRGMPQFATPNGRAMGPGGGGVAVRVPLRVDVDGGAADLRGAGAMPDAGGNRLGHGPAVAAGIDPPVLSVGPSVYETASSGTSFNSLNELQLHVSSIIKTPAFPDPDSPLFVLKWLRIIAISQLLEL